MKPWNCDACRKPIEVLDDYKPEFCCDGYMCGCYGAPINPVFCDDCEKQIFGEPVNK